MSMLVLAGEFRIVGSQPDGDSVRFYPDDVRQWDLVGGQYAVKRNAAGGAQLRLDGIDSLETHYAAGGGIVHQPLDLAHEARDRLLRWLGFRRVTRDELDEETVTATDPPVARGYIFTRSADRYGRCVAFVGRGDPPAASGSQVYVDSKLVRRTANYRQLQLGMAYPTYYRKLFPDLRTTLTGAVAQARPDRGVWPRDLTMSGLTVSGLPQLEKDAVIMPKLFRRVAAYLALGNGDTSLAGFRAFLEQEDDRVFLLPEGHYTGFDTVVDITGQTVRLTRPPEQMIFEEK